jgi:thioredoxin-related protein
MSAYTLSRLYEEYSEQRKLNITFEQFTFLLTSYPVLLIVSTDGKVDIKEWNYLKKSADELAELLLPQETDPELISDLKSILLNEFKYLLMNFDTWERKFIKTLKNYLKEKPELKHSILESIYLFASVSEGICEKEEIMIEHLRKELHIEESL